MKGAGDVYTNNPGLTNATVVITFPIPPIGAATVDSQAIRNAIKASNYQLVNSSAAVNAGSTLGGSAGIQIPTIARTKDYIFANRVGVPDIGAFELNGVPGPTFTPGPTAPPTENWDLDTDGDVDVFDFNQFLRKVMSKTESWSKLASFMAALRYNAH